MKHAAMQWLGPCMAVLAVTAVPVSAQPKDLAKRIDAYVEPFLEDGHLAGTLLVSRDGEVVYEKSWGMADRESEVRNTSETAFLVASVTKPITVMIASQLVDENRLNVEDTLDRWLPDFPRANEITVEHLLGHTAGIKHQLTERDDRSTRRSAADMVKMAAGQPLTFDPGTQSAYSSGGFSVLARVLELAGGASYADLLETRIFEPSGMQHTIDATAGTGDLAVAVSYQLVPGGVKRSPEQDYSYIVGAGSVYSTPADLHRLVTRLLDGTLGLAARDVLLRDDGFRWNGRTSGYRAFVDYHLDDGIVVIFAGNLLTGAIDQIRQNVPKLARGDVIDTPAPLAIEAFDIGAEKLASYAGAYRLRPDFDIELYIEDGILFASEWLLIPTSETTFFSPSDYGSIEVVMAEGGTEVERIDWTVGGRTWPCPRVTE